MDAVNIFWFRRDLRLHDNTGLNKALKSNLPILPIFIFDTNITNELNDDDSRINFIHNQLAKINKKLLLVSAIKSSYFTINNGANLLNFHPYWQRILTGVIIVAVVFFDQLKNRSK